MSCVRSFCRVAERFQYVSADTVMDEWVAILGLLGPEAISSGYFRVQFVEFFEVFCALF